MNGSKSKSNIETINYDELRNIYENEECLTYKELCNRLNIKEMSGNSKIKQMRELTGICRYEKIGRKYIIKELCDNYRDYFYYRANPNNYKELDDYSFRYMNEAGIYKIQLNNIIYIGQTKNFRNRFVLHKNNPSGFLNNTQKLIKNGATFSILEIVPDEKERLKKEKEYINKYSADDSYICINDNYNVKKHPDKINKNKTKEKIRNKKKSILVDKEYYSEIINLLKEKGYDVYGI